MTSSNRRVLNIILALLVSVGAWMFVVYNYYPMTDVKYTDVPLTYEGQKELADRGLAVSEASTKGISVRLSQKRVNFNNYSAKDIKVVANVGECVAGENSVSINVSGPRDTSVISHDIDTIKVMVERAESEYMDIDVIYSGSTAENEEPMVVDIANSSVEVVCASSKLSSIKKVAAVLDRNEVGDTIKSYTADLVALDADGNVVPYAVLYPSEISLDACAGIVKDVALELKISGGTDEDYERKYTAPETVKIKGPVKELEKIDKLTAEEMDISYYYENTDLKLELSLPENVVFYDPEFVPTLKLIVTKIEKPQETENTENAEEQG